MQRGDLLEKTQKLGKIEIRRKRGQQRIRWLVDTTNSMDMNLSKLQEIVKDRELSMLQSMGLQSKTWLSYWTRTTNSKNLTLKKLWVGNMQWYGSKLSRHKKGIYTEKSIPPSSPPWRQPTPPVSCIFPERKHTHKRLTWFLRLQYLYHRHSDLQEEQGLMITPGLDY